MVRFESWPLAGLQVGALTVVAPGDAEEVRGPVLTVDAEAPHRLLSWRRAGGGRSELAGAERMAYWRLNAPGDEKRRPGSGRR